MYGHRHAYIDWLIFNMLRQVVTLVMMMLALGRTGICLFAPVFVTGMIGNGLSLRPMPFMMFFIAVSIAVWAMMHQAERSRRLADHRRRQKEQQMAEALSGRDGW